jgi:hypothetical protein
MVRRGRGGDPDASSFVVEGHHHETLIRDAEPAGTEIRWLRARRDEASGLDREAD